MNDGKWHEGKQDEGLRALSLTGCRRGGGYVEYDFIDIDVSWYTLARELLAKGYQDADEQYAVR